MGRVVVLGSVNRDLVLAVPRHPRPGETVAALGLAEHPGGKGANQAVAAARAGVPVLLVGATGDDGFGAVMCAFLTGEGIDLRHLRAVSGRPTGLATITVDPAGENAIVVVAGANAAPEAVDAGAIGFVPGDVAVAQFEVPEAFVAAGFAQARAAGARTLLNPAPIRPLAPALLALTDILVLNETELAEAAGVAAGAEPVEIRSGMERLRTHSAQVVVVTRGRAGALALDDAGRLLAAPGVAARAVDTTGAGDCFVGVLAAGLAEGLALEPALARANRAAAISVTRPGAASSIPRRAEYA